MSIESTGFITAALLLVISAIFNFIQARNGRSANHLQRIADQLATDVGQLKIDVGILKDRCIARAGCDETSTSR